MASVKKENYLVCEYCKYVTLKKNQMESHNKTDKHKRNTEKNYVVFDDPESLISKFKAKEAKKKSNENQ
jgi:hypothetical protein